MAGRTKPDPAQPPEDEDDSILRIGETPEEPKYDVLFKIDGKPYKGLVNPPGSVFRKYIDTIRKHGPNVALSWLTERLLDPEAYTALLESPKVSEADSRAITDLCISILTGKRADAPKAKP